MISIEIVALVYKSKDYCKFITDQLLEYGHAKGAMVSSRIVANDPEVPRLLDYPREKGISIAIYNDETPEDYYLNRVYRCWNWAVRSSWADYVCLVNSDMAFSEGWLEALVRQLRPNIIPTSRLVESGKLRSGAHAISRDFGRSPGDFNKAEWEDWAEKSKEQKLRAGGLFMPVLFERQMFLNAGQYPEGNVYEDGPGTCNGPVIESGDAYFFRTLRDGAQMHHVTVFDSLVYHIQEGEKDE